MSRAALRQLLGDVAYCGTLISIYLAINASVVWCAMECPVPYEWAPGAGGPTP